MEVQKFQNLHDLCIDRAPHSILKSSCTFASIGMPMHVQRPSGECGEKTLVLFDIVKRRYEEDKFFRSVKSLHNFRPPTV